VSATMNIERLQEELQTKRFGKKIVFLHETVSTNDFAKKLARYGAAEGTVVIAEAQTAGRGRLGREWFSPKGGLYFSIVLRPKLRANEAVKLVFVASLAVAKVLDEVYGLRVETKWPNDVLVNGRKICGILSEMNTVGEKVNYVIVGVGINVNTEVQKKFPEELRIATTSLKNELCRKIRLGEMFRIVLERLDEIHKQFLKEGFVSVLARWKKYAYFLGCHIDVTCQCEKLSGLASDVDSDGTLIVKLEDGTVKHVSTGDISLRSR